MKKIYQNFDGLDVSFQCAVPKYILDKIKNAQQSAISERKPVPIEIGKSRIPILVAENGMKGGYALRFSTQPENVIWAIADSDDAERWNVRVSAGSLMLALNGYENTKNIILSFLIEELNAISPENSDFPLERISRFDYCFDFLADNFVPDAKRFLTHNRSKRRYQGNIANIPPLDFLIVDQGKNIQTITIGKMPNRQITIYNKRREIVASKKSYWWQLWELNPAEIKSDVWRIEVRAGKKELNKWNLRRFGDFEKKSGDVIISMLKDYRYVIPNEKDKNRARWAMDPFWKECIESAHNYLAEYISNASREEIVSGIKEEISKRYKAFLSGSLTSYAALHGYDISEMPGVLDEVRGDVLGAIRKNPIKFQKNHKKSENRFRHLIQGKN